MTKQAASRSKGEIATETDNNPIYRTVMRELRTLKDAAENASSGRWTIIKDKAAEAGMFVTSKHK
ncbi:hypothetical protein PWG15_12465 [Ensifer adhaerens]|uniref:hypothetical protein n=1 Tax=Ensifer adhaerens TaxID=106592 RepID=UPI0023A9EAF5|nr:hypothetical protein [Ensifer adhaerens]WDZ75430.1 hypothetical protein PWG15_12465 [Ensifer adhaerens]